MKSLILILWLLLNPFGLLAQDPHVHTCGADELMHWRSVNDPDYFKSIQILSNITQQSTSLTSGKTYYIPVVFHIIADTQSVLDSFDLARIQRQLDTLNHHFAENDADIIFCLAQNLPKGITQTQWSQFGTGTTLEIPGVTYTLTLDTNLTTLDFIAMSRDTNLYNLLPFRPDQYLNIYVVDSISLNGSFVDGAANVGPSLELVDGIAIQYDAFVGSSCLGKTLVHEVGHWLGLFHVFGEDYVCDTYPQDSATNRNSVANCSTAYTSALACTANPDYDQGENHMDYHTESCLHVLTLEQIARMHRLLDFGRPFIHSDLNLINTGIRRIGGCLDSNIVSAEFTMSENGVCSGNAVSLQGVNVNYDQWTWTASWDSTKNNGNPIPAAVVNFSNPNDTASSPNSTVTIDAAGVWDIILTVTHLDTSGVDTIAMTVHDTLELTILDCSVSDQRNRITTVFDSTDWNVSYISITNMPYVSSDSIIGYMVSGSAFINGQNEVGIIMRVNNLGQTIWRKSVEIAGKDVRLFDVESEVRYGSNTDCYAFTGYTGQGDSTNLLFLITDRLGITLYQQTFSMAHNSTVLPYATGLQVIQLSAAFDSVFAVVGFAGYGADSIDAKTGFAIGIDPSSGITWSKFFESAALSNAPIFDYDIAENITEITADFGNGLEPAIVVGGNTNRTAQPRSSGAFLSCFTIDSLGFIAEQWRKNLETPTNNSGEIEMIAVDFDANRLFAACFNGQSHGTFIFELDRSTGAIFSIGEILDFDGNELIIENNNAVLTGEINGSFHLAAFKIELPQISSNNWLGNHSTFRTYDYTRLDKWGGSYNPNEYLTKPQNIVVSPNGGYMMVRETEQNPSIGKSPIGLIFNKVDDFLVGACSENRNKTLGGLTTILNHPIITDSVRLTISDLPGTVSCVAQTSTCYLGICSSSLTGNASFSKCAEDTIVLTSILTSIGDFSYQWSPATGLSNDTILEPLCFVDTGIVYTLTVIDTHTQCVVLVGTYGVNVLDTVLRTFNLYKCYNDSIILTAFDSTLTTDYDYQWSPATSLSSTTDLEPICFSQTNQTYTLIARNRNNSCDVKIYQYVVTVKNVREHRILCVSNESGYFTNLSTPLPPVYRRYLLDLDSVLADLGITDTAGIWSSPTSSFPAFGLPYFNDTTNIVSASLLNYYNPLYYEYDTNQACHSLLILHFYDDPTISTPDTVYTCDGTTLTFNTSPLNSTTLHSWSISSTPIGTGSLTYLVSIPFDTILSVSYTFSYSPIIRIYSVIHSVSHCIGDVSFGASSSDQTTIIVQNPNTTITLDTCTNTLSVPYSTPTNTIEWYKLSDSIPVSTASSFVPTINGQYYAIIHTPHCAVHSDTVNFTLPNLLTILTTQTNNLCFGANTGTATALVAAGVTPYTYLWSNAQDSAIATGLAAGVYQVTVTDNCLNQVIDTVIITEPSALIVNATQSTIPCTGDSTGIATVSASGGTPSYSYLWSNTQTDSIATNLTPRLYIVTVTDTNNCSVTDSILIISNPLPPVVANASAVVLCFRDSVTLTASGANTYIWSDTTITNGLSFAPPATTTYTVTGIDTNGCQNTASITIVVTPRFAVAQTVSATTDTTVTIQQTICAISPSTGTYNLQNSIPTGWTLINGAGSVNDSLSFGQCDTFFITIQLPSNPNLCDLDIENCVNLTGGACAPVQNCLMINTGAMPNMATIVPPSIATFNQAIQAQLLLDPLVNGQITPQDVVFQGNIIQDNFQYFFAARSKIKIGSNVQITIPIERGLFLNQTDIEGCTHLWRSITVESGARFRAENSSAIKDALYAIELKSGAIANIDNTTFAYNYASIYTAPSPTPNLASLTISQVLFDGGALLPVLGPTVAGNWAYAGILLNDFAALTMSNNVSTFQNLANGIVAYRSNIRISKAAIFRNILPRGYAPDGTGIFAENDLLNVYNVTMLGQGITGLATFDNCQNGIVTRSSNLTVLDNNMLRMRALGVESRLAQSRRLTISRNNVQIYSNFSGTGIRLVQNDPTLQTTISENTIEAGLIQVGQGILNIAVAGIALREGGVPHLVNINNNNIKLRRASNGISILGNEGARVFNNTINLQAPTLVPILIIFPGLNINRSGIFVQNSDTVALRCNNITSTLNLILPQTFGINITTSQFTADCNTLFRTATGIRIDGNCNGSLVRGNNFERNNLGLHYTSTAVTGSGGPIGHNYAGNRWLGTWSVNQIGARHDDNIISGLSRYNVSNLQFLVPPNYQPSSWFILANGNDYTCANNSCNSPLPLAIPLLNNADIAIVNNQIPQTPTALPWELRKGLYNKLDKNPVFLINPAMGQFYNTYQNQAIGAVVETADARKSTMLINTSDAVVLEQQRINNEAILDTLNDLDSLYLATILNHTNWIAQRQQLLQQWQQIHNNSNTVCNGLYGICQTESQQAQTTNATIFYNNTPEENEQVVNDIYLQTVALGNQNFSLAQIQTLYDIAHQCPKLGGTAVYRARSIHALIAEDSYNDDCALPQLRTASIVGDTCYNEVYFLNPSLEGIPFPDYVPAPWSICEFTPDTQPYDVGTPPASHQQTYIGQVGGNPSVPYVESFGQSLIQPLSPGIQYGFNVDLRKATLPFNPLYGSLSIWVGDSSCYKQQQVYTIITTDTIWTTHKVTFIPNQYATHIVFSGEVTNYSSYIFIDNLRPIPCGTIMDTISPLLPDRTDNTGNGVYTNITTTEPNKFNIYPNPNQAGLLTVEWQKNISNGVIIVLDALGREVGIYQVVDNIISQQIDIQHLPSGYYSVLLREETQIVGREKLIVIKQ